MKRNDALKRLHGKRRVRSKVSFVIAVAIGAILSLAPLVRSMAQESQISETTRTSLKMHEPDTFGQDVDFLKRHVDTIVLGAAGKAQVAVVPAYQGRVMTSTAAGPDGASFGWINYAHIESGESTPHINVFGGEERFWLGPEGGQFSIYFAPSAKFEFSDWQTPPLIDSVTYPVAEQNENSVTFRHEAEIANYSKTRFQLRIERTVELIESGGSLGIDDGQLEWVGYRTVNQLTNTGKKDWSKETGLLSIWLLGMYKHGPETTVVIPFNKGSEQELGPIVNDTYFGKVPAERLKVGDDVLFFSGDGKFRSKIGLTPQRATDICGSYDAKGNVLTIVKYNQPGPETTDYVNSMWELQDEPYSGDVINSYNDGPAEPGEEPLGPFYELETSSPALALKAGETGSHIQETYHIVGPRAQLDKLAQQMLRVSLDEIEAALGN